MNTLKEFGESLKNICSEKNISLDELARVLDTTPDRAQKVLDGEMFINPFERVESLCSYLDITVFDLIGKE